MFSGLLIMLNTVMFSVVVLAEGPSRMELSTANGGRLDCMCRYRVPEHLDEDTPTSNDEAPYRADHGEGPAESALKSGPWMPAPKTNQFHLDAQGNRLPLFSEKHCYDSCQEHKCGPEFEANGWDSWYICLHKCYAKCYDKVAVPAGSLASRGAGTRDFPQNEKTTSTAGEKLNALLKTAIPASPASRDGDTLTIHIGAEDVAAVGMDGKEIPIDVKTEGLSLPELQNALVNTVNETENESIES